jgi:hypothetical protein
MDKVGCQNLLELSGICTHNVRTQDQRDSESYQTELGGSLRGDQEDCRSQVARYLLEIFALRFESVCSIYLSSLSFHLIVIVGPMVGTTVLSMALPESLLRLPHKTLI